MDGVENQRCTSTYGMLWKKLKWERRERKINQQKAKNSHIIKHINQLVWIHMKYIDEYVTIFIRLELWNSAASTLGEWAWARASEIERERERAAETLCANTRMTYWSFFFRCRFLFTWIEAQDPSLRVMQHIQRAGSLDRYINWRKKICDSVIMMVMGDGDDDYLSKINRTTGIDWKKEVWTRAEKKETYFYSIYLWLWTSFIEIVLTYMNTYNFSDFSNEGKKMYTIKRVHISYAHSHICTSC